LKLQDLRPIVGKLESACSRSTKTAALVSVSRRDQEPAQGETFEIGAMELRTETVVLPGRHLLH
jgi:hypothetical protein